MNSERISQRRSVTRLALVALLGVIAFALVGCGGLIYESSDKDSGVLVGPDMGVSDEYFAEETRDGSIPAPEEPQVPGGSGQDASSVPADERYIIRTVGVRIRVDDVEDAVDSLRATVDGLGGVVTGLQVSTDDEIPVYRYEALGSLADGAPLKGYVTARIPVDELPGFLESVSDLGTVLRQSSDEADVTQDHIDLSARLGNLNSQEQRLRELFDRAETVEDMLDVERELGRVRGEIESLTAQIAFLERQAAMATVTIELAGTPPVIRPSGNDWGFVDAITTGIRGLVGTINAMIIVAISALPLVVVGIVTWLLVRGFLRRRAAKRQSVAAATPIDEYPAGTDDEGVHE